MDERLGQHKWNAGRAPVEETGLQAHIDEHRDSHDESRGGDSGDRARLRRIPGGDVDVVSDAVGLDSRIGRTYLTGGLGFGGPCVFPATTWRSRSSRGRPQRSAPGDERAESIAHDGPGAAVARPCVARHAVAVLGVAYRPGSRPSPTLPLDTGPFPGVNWNHAAGP
ncbi:MAG: hypothetical protein DMF98_27350 [Acidobacteria bacterium]|nr:MAG: hypothetical protein DMF98_27350 [Acidobacteriota bacterium]